MIDWNGYRALLAAVEHGSFSAAARALGISQPTVGRHVAELESALGARLLVRRGKGVAPSPAGERVMEHVRAMGASAREAARSGADDLVQVKGVVRISSSETLGTLWLTHRLRALCARHPGLRVELVIDNVVVNLATLCRARSA